MTAIARILSVLSPLLMAGCDCQKEAEWVDLDPEKWKPLSFGGEGAAEWTDGILSLDAGAELTGTLYEGELPAIPYEIEFEARKVTGSDFFCGFTFPVRSKDECVTLIVGGWGGGTVGISSIDGQDASSNETTSYHNFDKGRWYSIRIKVEEKGIEASLDGRSIVNLEIEGKKLGLRQGVIELCAPLGYATWQTAAEVKGLRWRSLVD